MHFYSIIIIVKIFIIGSHPMRAKESKLLSGSNLFPQMMWIIFSWRTGIRSEHWEEITSRESILMWVQQRRLQPEKQETVRPTLIPRESSQAPTAHGSSFWPSAHLQGPAISPGLPVWAHSRHREASFCPFFSQPFASPRKVLGPSLPNISQHGHITTLSPTQTPSTHDWNSPKVKSREYIMKPAPPPSSSITLGRSCWQFQALHFLFCKCSDTAFWLNSTKKSIWPKKVWLLILFNTVLRNDM